MPGSYKAYLGNFGWASLEGFLGLYGLGEDVPTYLDLAKATLSERAQRRPSSACRLVPLMYDGAGNHYRLDVESRGQGECPVVFWDHNSSLPQDPEQVAPTLEAWLLEEPNTL